jgi:hypothetical protein
MVPVVMQLPCGKIRLLLLRWLIILLLFLFPISSVLPPKALPRNEKRANDNNTTTFTIGFPNEHEGLSVILEADQLQPVVLFVLFLCSMVDGISLGLELYRQEI